MQTSGRKDIYNAIWLQEKLIERLALGSSERQDAQKVLSLIRRGQYFNEEQLKSMYRAGWREGDWLTWLPDDFDDEY